MQDFDFIETPENVELQRELAGIGTRFIAGLLDSLIIAGIMLILLIVAFITGAATMQYQEVAGLVIGFLIVAVFLVYWGYFVFFELVTNGQSPGKKSQKIRVVKVGGGAITFTDVAIRNLLRAVDMIGVYAVAGICMFLTRKSQRLGDLAAGTLVISEALRNYAAKSDKKASVQWEGQATAEALRMTGLTPEEYGVVANYWHRREELTLEARQRLLTQLVRPILLRTGQIENWETVEAMERRLDVMMRRTVEPNSSQQSGETEDHR